MLLPDHCSASRGGKRCAQPPDYVISVVGSPEEFMIGVVCQTHRTAILQRLTDLQGAGKIPKGSLVFKPIKMVSTDCITGSEDDYIDIEMNRGIDSERRIS